MVKIAIAGGSGQVAREVIDALAVTNKHEIIILSRGKHDSMDYPLGQGINQHTWRVVDYNDPATLVEALRGVHTLLSFVQPLADVEGKAQKNLIDAAVAASVKRFAPSEYGSASLTHMPWYASKEKIREYLKSINREKKVIEYTLFQPGLFLDYLAFPHKTAKYIDPLQSVFDFQNRRAIVVDGYEDAIVCFTSAADAAATVARAVEYEQEWPEIGGIQGNRLTCSQVIALGERIRGGKFTVEKVSMEDLAAGSLKSSWALEKRHKAVAITDSSPDSGISGVHSGLAEKITIGLLVSFAKGEWAVSDELNQLFPEYRFDKIETFLGRVWQEEM